VRNGLHQFADFRFQKLVRHYQSLHSVAGTAATSRDGLVSCDFKAIRF
jgi:hypothetical protein